MVWGEEEVEEKLRKLCERQIRRYSDELTVGGVTISSAQELVQSGPTEEERERVGGVLLYIAARACRVEEVRRGLASGAPVDHVVRGSTPLQAAMLSSDSLPPDHPVLLETVTLLCRAGADPDRGYYGRSMVEAALEYNHPLVAQALLLTMQTRMSSQEYRDSPVMQEDRVSQYTRVKPWLIDPVLSKDSTYDDMTTVTEQSNMVDMLLDSPDDKLILFKFLRSFPQTWTLIFKSEMSQLYHMDTKSIGDLLTPLLDELGNPDSQVALVKKAIGKDLVVMAYSLLVGMLARMSQADLLSHDDLMTYLFSKEINVGHQAAMFGPSSQPEPLQMCHIGGRTLLQLIADRKEQGAKLREEFVLMQIRIDQETDGKADRIIAGLNNSLESGEPLMVWSESVKSKLPISATSMAVKGVTAGLMIVWGLALIAFDVYTDSDRTLDFKSYFNSNGNTSINGTVQTTAPPNCTCPDTKDVASPTGLDEANRYSAEEWFQLYVMSMVHLIMPWALGFPVAAFAARVADPWRWWAVDQGNIHTKRADKCRRWFMTALNICGYPVATLVEKLVYQIQMVINLGKDPSEQSVKMEKKELNDAIENNEVKEVILLVVELTFEASFQFYIQSLLVLPQLYEGVVSAYKSGSLADSPMRYGSIVSSFFVISRSFFKIRNLAKHGALAASFKSGLILIVRTAVETIIRIMSVGVYLYVLQDNMSPMTAVGLYYGHCLIMVLFNIFFNSEKCSSLTYVIDLTLNSLSSTYSYNFISFTSIMQQMENKTDTENQRTANHKPTLVRQTFFYIVITCENVFLTLSAAMNAGDRIQIDDGFHQFSISYSSLCNIILVIWILWILQIFLIFLFYATHPSNVAVNPKQYGKKLKVAICGSDDACASCCSGKVSCGSCCEAQPAAVDLPQEGVPLVERKQVQAGADTAAATDQAEQPVTEEEAGPSNGEAVPAPGGHRSGGAAPQVTTDPEAAHAENLDNVDISARR